MAGTNLEYKTADEETRAGLDKSREEEWSKWKEFAAAYKFPRKVLQPYLDKGHKIIPTQWVETDKNEHLKRPGQTEKHVPKYKSNGRIRQRVILRGLICQFWRKVQ